MVALACGRADNAVPASAITTSASPAIVPSPASWQTYTNPSDGYSLRYPPNWRMPVPPGDHTAYLSNENAGSPSELDAAGVFVTITVLIQDCSVQRIPGTVVSQRSTKNTGYAGVRYVLDVSDQNKYIVAFVVQHGSACLVASFLSWSKPTRDGNLTTADTIIDSLTLQ